jgi:hypothetical protein
VEAIGSSVCGADHRDVRDTAFRGRGRHARGQGGKQRQCSARERDGQRARRTSGHYAAYAREDVVHEDSLSLTLQRRFVFLFRRGAR